MGRYSRGPERDDSRHDVLLLLTLLESLTSSRGLGFLVHFESEVLKRAHKNFSFVNGRYASLSLRTSSAYAEKASVA